MPLLSCTRSCSFKAKRAASTPPTPKPTVTKFWSAKKTVSFWNRQRSGTGAAKTHKRKQGAPKAPLSFSCGFRSMKRQKPNISIEDKALSAALKRLQCVFSREKFVVQISS
jgi:hypothetical protein